MERLTRREREVLLELLKGARTSDQEIARRINTSRPTVIKIRQKLEKTMIKRYVPVLEFKEIGLNVIATTFFRWDDFSRKKEMTAVFNYIKKLPFVVRFNGGVGMGSMTMVLVSVHKDLTEYETFWKDLQEQGGENIREVLVFLGSTREMFKKYDFTTIFIDELLKQSDAVPPDPQKKRHRQKQHRETE